MGSLAKLLKIQKAEEKTTQISVERLLFYVEQIILRLGQSNNAMTYYRKLNYAKEKATL